MNWASGNDPPPHPGKNKSMPGILEMNSFIYDLFNFHFSVEGLSFIRAPYCTR